MEQNGFVVENFKELEQAFKLNEKRMFAACDNALSVGAANILAKAQENLYKNKSVVTGLLRGSGRAEKLRNGEHQVGFFPSEDPRCNGQGYAEYVENGRRSGKMPPLKIIAAWAYKKFQLENWKKAHAIGFAIARNIAKKGTKPHPFFRPAVELQKRTIVENIANAARQIIR